MLQSFHYLQVSLPSIYDSANFTSIEEENASEGIESCEYNINYDSIKFKC